MLTSCTLKYKLYAGMEFAYPCADADGFVHAC